MVKSGEFSLDNTDTVGIIGFAHEVGHLKHMTRTGWLLAGVRSPESVAEHSFRVGILAYVIAAQEGADVDRAATLGLFHDLPETRTGDANSVTKRYIHAATPHAVINDQVAELPDDLAQHIVMLIDEHESAKTAETTVEARCSRDADKLECLLQAREYQREGYQQLQPWITTMLDSVSTATGKRLTQAALEVSPNTWWEAFAASFALPEVK